MNKNKLRLFFSDLHTALQGCRQPECLLVAQVTRWEPTLDRTSPSQGHSTPTHADSDWDNVDTPMRLTCAVLELGQEGRGPGKTHTDMGLTCTLHTLSGPNQESIFFHQHYNKATLNETRLFKGLLYMVQKCEGSFISWLSF